MTPRPRSFWARYGVALLSVFVAGVARWVQKEYFHNEYPNVPYFLALIFSAWYGGFGPTVMVAVLAVVVGPWFASADRAPTDHPVLGILLYIAISLGIAGFGGLLRRARLRIIDQMNELTRQHQQLAATLSSIGDAVIVTDATGLITSMNPIAELLTRWPQAEAVSRPLDDIFQIVNEETRKAVESPVTKVLQQGSIVGLANHTVLIAKDGMERPIDDSAAPIRGADGKLAGVVLVFRDITERRERERLQREAERRKDEFLAVLAHELRNPLAPIGNALEILKLQEGVTPPSVEARDVAERQLRYLTRLVDDLLDVSRIMQGKIELRKSRVELSRVTAQAIETVRPLIDSERHELTVDLPDEPVWLEADEVRLAQVLANLLSNAAKYTEPGGKLSLAASVEEGQAVIRVRDSGIGIAPDVLPRLFQMFMQVAPGASRSQGGLGIGLTLVKSLMAMHDGTVAAHSDGLGHGSEFMIRLPVVEPATIEDHPAPVPKTKTMAGPGRRILVVDDNADAAQSLGVLLRLRGHDVGVAFSGQAALAAARNQPPELVFLDIGMPGMDGYEVARQLRTEFNSSLTIIALTGWGAEQDRQRSRDAGFDHHLTKPVDLAALEDVLSSANLAPAL